MINLLTLQLKSVFKSDNFFSARKKIVKQILLMTFLKVFFSSITEKMREEKFTFYFELPNRPKENIVI